MSGTENFADTVAGWAKREPSVKGLMMFGSQVRVKSDVLGGPDAYSDWDFEIVTSEPEMFQNSSWVRRMTQMTLHAYAVREPRLGAMPKVHLHLEQAEADFVIVPTNVARVSKLAVRLGLHRRPGLVRSRLQAFALVMRPGYKILKGEREWGNFLKRVFAEIPDPRLDVDAILKLANGFVCDYQSATNRLKRGELLHVQRILHCDLAETNFRLMHELKLRRGEQSFPEARRIEWVATSNELSILRVTASPDSQSLQAALEKSASTLRELVCTLVGNIWEWPER